MPLNGQRSVPVCAHAKGIGALNLQQIRQTIEGLGNLRVMDGHVPELLADLLIF